MTQQVVKITPLKLTLSLRVIMFKEVQKLPEHGDILLSPVVQNKVLSQQEKGELVLLSPIME